MYKKTKDQGRLGYDVRAPFLSGNISVINTKFSSLEVTKLAKGVLVF